MPRFQTLRFGATATGLGLGAGLGALLPGAAQGADVREFQDSFEGGETALSWRPFSVGGGPVVRGELVEDAPDGDQGIGVLPHRGGSYGTVSYADTVRAEDRFEVEAYVHCPLEPDQDAGALGGLAFYVHGANQASDPDASGYYRLVCDHRLGGASFSLAYVGANIGWQPLEIERYPLIEQGEAARSGDPWHKLRVVVDQGLIELYLDDQKLNERPIPAERVITDIANVGAGYAGVYAGHIGAIEGAQARVDGFVYRVP